MLPVGEASPPALEQRHGHWGASGYFLTSAVFHYLGPSFAVLLFAHLAPLGVAWLRIAAAAAVFALWRRPWRLWRRATLPQRRLYLGLGLVLAAMNSLFYLAIQRLPLATVGAIEYLGVIGVAAVGARTSRNGLALAVTVIGVILLTRLLWLADPLGVALALLNAIGFVLYLLLGHQVARTRPAGRAGRWSGVDQLGLAMLIATAVALPIGLTDALPAFGQPLWLLWGVGVGICSSVIPYVADQLAMARLGRATFALMLSLMPAAAVAIGALVLGQIPSAQDLIGIALIIVGIVLHREAPARAGT